MFRKNKNKKNIKCKIQLNSIEIKSSVVVVVEEMRRGEKMEFKTSKLKRSKDQLGIRMAFWDFVSILSHF